MNEAPTIATAIAPAIARNTRIGKYSLSRPSITTLVGGIARPGCDACTSLCAKHLADAVDIRRMRSQGNRMPSDRLTRTSAAEPRIDGGSDGARTRDLRRDRPAL